MEKKVTSINKGLFTDSTEVQRPKGTWAFALNTLIGSWEGDYITVTNEDGNQLCYELPEDNYTLIGAELLPDNNIVVFLANDTYSIIGVHKTQSCEFEIVIKTSCLDFKRYHQIDALTKILRGCENMVYFTDGVNPYRSVNLDNLSLYLNDGYDQDSANADPDNGWNCNKLDHFMSFDLGCISSMKVNNSGGDLLSGAYQFAFRYLDDNLNPTDWSPLSNVIYIYNENITGEPYSIDGEAAQDVNNYNNTSKSITLVFGDLDSSFKYIQIAAAESIFGTATIDNVYLLDRRLIPAGLSVTYTYQGFNPTTHTVSTIDAITVPPIKLDVVQAHTQIDNRLLLANVSNNTKDWATFQKAVLLSKMKWVTYEDKEIFDSDPLAEQNQSTNPNILFTNKTWMSDEVYAFGLVFLFNDGSTSPVFHIPGRSKDLYNGVDLSTIAGDTLHDYQSNVTPAGQWDSELLTVVPDTFIYTLAERDGFIGESNVQHIPDTEFVNCPGPQETVSPEDSLDFSFTRNGGVVEMSITNLNPGDSVLVRVMVHNETDGVPAYDTVLPPFTTTASQHSYPFVIGNGVTFTNKFLIWTSRGGNTFYPEQQMFVTSRQIFLETRVRSIRLPETKNKHLGCQIERWKIHNTYISLNPDQTEGYMGYHENPNCLYEDAINCQRDFVFDAEGIGGENLVGKPIRHHRMPDIPHTNGKQLTYTTNVDKDNKDVLVHKLGIKADVDDVYAALPVELRDTIKGHYIVVGQRDDFNRTVVDKGFMWKVQSNALHAESEFANTIGSTDFHNESQAIYTRNSLNRAQYREGPGTINFSTEKDLNVTEYISPRLIWDSSIKIGDYVKYERMLKCKVVDDFNNVYPGGFYNKNINVINSYFASTDYNVRAVAFYDDYIQENSPNNVGSNNPAGTTFQTVQGYIRPINNGVILPYNAKGASSFTTNITLSNATGRQTTSFYELGRPFPLPTLMNGGVCWSYAYTALMRDESEANLQQNLVDQGLVTTYTSIKNYKEVFCTLGDIIYFRFTNCFIPKDADPENIIKGGDTFITQIRHVKTAALRRESDTEKEWAGGSVMLWALVESDFINSSLAHSERASSRYAPKEFSYDYYLTFIKSLRYNKDSFNYQILNGYPDNEEDVTTYGEFKYDYNKDFGKSQIENPLFPLDDNYDYCDQCAGKETNTIYYSEKSFAGDKLDKYKTILANSSFPIPSESGEITNLFLEKDQLYCHTPKALWQVQIRPQQLKTNEANLFVGTGSIGSIPPKRLVSTDQGYSGSIDKFATISTQYGTFFADRNSGRLFLFTGRLNEVSRAGMEKWFRNNLEVEWAKWFFIQFGVEYPISGTSWTNSVGYQAVYDPRHERIILHKKDFAVNGKNIGGLYNGLAKLPTTGKLDTLYLVMTKANSIDSYIWNGQYEKIDFTNKEFYKNLGWTISYSLKAQTWVSYHSYQPNFMYFGADAFYSFINERLQVNRVWKHFHRNYQTYYGIKYPKIVELANNENPVGEKVFGSFSLISETSLYDAQRGEYNKVESVTYDHFYVYNTHQISSKRPLVVKQKTQYQDVRLAINQTLIDRTENYWRFNRFRDERLTYNNTMFDRSWNTINNYYGNFGQGYIDKVPNPTNVDVNKNIYKQARFRDKFIKTRLFFNPVEDYKIVTEIMTVLTNNSLR